MGKEIERKFLIDQSIIGDLKNGSQIKQGYISTTNNTVVRVRVADQKAYLTLKGENSGATRSEFEYEIPTNDAEEIILELCSGPIIDKTRYVQTYKGHTWEIDVFHGDNKGLVVAEVELENEDEHVEMPKWIQKEVTSDKRYYNSNLLNNPYNSW